MAHQEGQDDEKSDIVAKIKAYLQEEGVPPEILQNLDAFLAEEGNPNRTLAIRLRHREVRLHPMVVARPVAAARPTAAAAPHPKNPTEDQR
jgi:hypothetical protein